MLKLMRLDLSSFSGSSINSNLLSLSKIKENITNNCSDMCFYEFSKIKEDKKVCEVNCGKIEDENNIYYNLCGNNEENIMMNSTITESTMISGTNSESISSSNNESISSSDSESTSTSNQESTYTSNQVSISSSNNESISTTSNKESISSSNRKEINLKNWNLNK